MSSSTFTSTNAVDMAKERDWPSDLGMLDWDTTKIMFTKRSLIEFLRYTGTTVDTNFANIQKLPRYAQFGRLTGTSETPATATESTTASTDVVSDPVPTEPEPAWRAATYSNPLDAFKPSRRVRTVPGGPSSHIFGNSVDEGVLATAPPKEQQTGPATVSGSQSITTPEPIAGPDVPSTEPQPSSATDNQTGHSKTTPGASSLTNFWDADEEEVFKPTRRVRQTPGGQDSISGIF